MKDPEIQQATASEPLSIEEEYGMQRSWRKDPDKLTFIAGVPTAPLPDAEVLRGKEGYTMVGDVNLFITSEEDESASTAAVVGELELMIAEKSQQGKGLGRAVLISFLQFVLEHEESVIEEYHRGRQDHQKRKFDHFRVKIGQENTRSLRLFAGLGFQQIGEANYFGEVEMRRVLDQRAVEELAMHFGLDKAQEIRYESEEDLNEEQLH
jgi:GNAT superfamily N-acetyltransferase